MRINHQLSNGRLVDHEVLNVAEILHDRFCEEHGYDGARREHINDFASALQGLVEDKFKEARG